MGMRLFSACGCDPTCQPVNSGYQAPAVQNPNPNPRNFSVLELFQVGKHAVARVRYPDCTTYEGEKTLLLRNCTAAQVSEATFLDPHFCKSHKHLTPFARFEPTPEGLAAAIMCAQSLS